MQVYQRVSVLANAWRIPHLGVPADEPAPSWLVTKIQSEEVEIHSLGGLAIREPNRSIIALPGDYVVHSEDGSIEFCTADEFTQKFTLLDLRRAA